jgi:hypothetical protein
MPPPLTLDAKDKAFLKAWDEEIDAEEAEAFALVRQELTDANDARARARAALAPMRAKLLQAAGTTDAAVRALAEDDFARMRKNASALRKKATAALKKRVSTNKAEVKKLLAGVDRR